jgi:predicted AAA+ superfamily ATPase
MVPRTAILRRLEQALARAPVVALIGARQVGKTTLARQLRLRHPGPPVLDLERSQDRAQLADPELALGAMRGLVVLDEVQRLPQLFPALRVLVDRPENPARFLVIGSAGPELLKLGGESLAGRIEWVRLGGLSLDEVGVGDLSRLWLRGGFPPALLAGSDADSSAWRRAYLESLLFRDLPALGIRVAPPALERFLAMLAHRHGQPWNGAEMARSLAVSQPAARRYLDLLTQAFLLRQQQPWSANVGKRQVKSPRVWIEDTGLLHSLLDLPRMSLLERHPVIGASWEGFILEQARRALGARPDQSYFWRTHAGAELDLLVVVDGKRIGVEVKRTTSPRLTPSMRAVLADLKLDRLYVVHAGDAGWPMADRVQAVPAAELLKTLPDLSAGA